MTELTTEPRTMAKAQKTIMIPDDLYRMFAAQEKRSGVTFTRQAMAAFCAYFFTSANGPDPLWVEAVVAFENGELPIHDLPAHVARAKSERARKIATRSRELQANSTYTPFDPDEMDREAGRMHTEALEWEHSATRSADPIESFMALSAHYRMQVGFQLAPPDSPGTGSADPPPE